MVIGRPASRQGQSQKRGPATERRRCPQGWLAETPRWSAGRREALRKSLLPKGSIQDVALTGAPSPRALPGGGNEKDGHPGPQRTGAISLTQIPEATNALSVRSRESGNPGATHSGLCFGPWVPACAGTNGGEIVLNS